MYTGRFFSAVFVLVDFAIADFLNDKYKIGWKSWPVYI